MNLEDFEKMLVDIQNNINEVKILNSVMMLAKELTAVEKALSLIQDKINEMIVEINALKQQRQESIETKEENNSDE